MIHNSDIETFYKRIDKHIILTGIIIENKILPKIIRACRLKPLMFIDDFQSFNYRKRAQFFNEWIDEFGNVLTIERDSKSISLMRTNREMISTDIFFGCSIIKTLEISKYILIGNYVDGQTIIVCCGNDDFLRVFSIKNNKTERIAPLSIGTEILCFIFQNAGIGTIRKIEAGEVPQLNGGIMVPLPIKKIWRENISLIVNNDMIMKEIDIG